jgi:mannose-6-phosphate isomerase-like protein (cupin superfamily)
MPIVPPLFRADALGEALNFLRMSETAYYQSRLVAPWGLMMPETCPKFHFVTAGECWLQTDNEEDRRLEAGDFVIESVGQWHRGSNPSTEPLKLLVIDQSPNGEANVELRK